VVFARHVVKKVKNSMLLHQRKIKRNIKSMDIKYILCIIFIAMISVVISMDNKSIAEICGAVMDSSPVIDAGIVIVGMENELSYNGLPRTGKYPGDQPDIGAWEWFPEVDCENPLGNWTGTPLTYNPRLVEPPPEKPSGLRVQ